MKYSCNLIWVTYGSYQLIDNYSIVLNIYLVASFDLRMHWR